MFKAIIILSLFIGMNGSYLSTNCHLNETQPDLVFEKCEKIRVTDLTTSCPIYDPSLCQTNPCFCDPVTLPSIYPCRIRYVCKWKVKSDPSSQNLSLNAKIVIGVVCSIGVLLLAVGVVVCAYRWNRVCFEVVTSENNQFYATFHSVSDTSRLHCTSEREINQ